MERKIIKVVKKFKILKQKLQKELQARKKCLSWLLLMKT